MVNTVSAEYIKDFPENLFWSETTVELWKEMHPEEGEDNFVTTSGKR